MRELPLIDNERVRRTQTLLEQAFRHETPEQVPFFFGITDVDQDPRSMRFADPHAVEKQMTGWGNWDEPLEMSLNSIRWWSEQTYTPLFPPPKLWFDCPQEIILTPFGVKYQKQEGGRVALDWSQPVIRSLPDDVHRLRERMDGFMQRGLIPELIEKAHYFLEQTDRRIPLTLPDYQSPLGLASKLMPSSDLMMALLLAPDHVRELLDVVADIILEFIQGLERAVGDKDLLQANIMLPEGCRGIIWDDFVSVITPEVYRAIATGPNDRILGYLGKGEMHTCGPCLGEIAESIMGHQNLLSFEVIFAAPDKTRTTEHLLGLKDQCRGRVLLNVIGMPFDLEHFTVDFVRRMNEGGGVLFTGCAGSERQVRQWLAVVEEAGQCRV